MQVASSIFRGAGFLCAKYKTWEEAKKSHLINLLDGSRQEDFERLKSKGVGQTTILKFLEEHPEEAKSHGSRGSHEIGFQTISRFLNWNEYRVKNSLERLHLIEDKIIDQQAIDSPYAHARVKLKP